jgi:2-keto-4-pentenoate hydratase
VNPRLVSALEAQLAARAPGGERVGWKLGVGQAERIGAHPAVGHLTTATVLEPGATFDGAGSTALHADVEVLVELTADVVPGEDIEAVFGVALELVDLERAECPPETIIAENIFHRAVAFGRTRHPSVPDGLSGRAIVDGEVRACAPAAAVTARMHAAAEVLAAIGERFRAGEKVITGSVVQVPVPAGAQVVADLGPLGAVALVIAGGRQKGRTADGG